MTGIYELYATDQDLEKTGFWFDITDQAKILLARAGGANVKFAKAIEVKTRPHRRQIEEDKMDLDLANKLMIEAFAESIVLDWTGITTAEGEDVPFTKENVVKLFLDLPDLFADVRDAAAKQSNFRASDIADDIKN